MYRVHFATRSEPEVSRHRYQVDPFSVNNLHPLYDEERGSGGKRRQLWTTLLPPMPKQHSLF